MKNLSIGVRHYWAKTAEIPYAGEAQKLAIELVLTAIMLPITVYCAISPGLGLFFVGFLVPTLMFSLGSILTAYYIIYNYLKRCQGKDSNSETKQ